MRREPHTETAESALIVIFKLIIGGLTSIILVALGTDNLQFWKALVRTSLQSVLRIVDAQVLGTVWSSCSPLLRLVFCVYKAAHRTQLRISSITLEKELKVLDCA